MRRALFLLAFGGLLACGTRPAPSPSLASPPRAPTQHSTSTSTPAALHCWSRLEDATEAYPLAQREFERASTAVASPILAAHIYEAIPRLFVDVSDTNFPTFDGDFTRRLAVWPHVKGQVAFSRSLVGRIRALARAPDTTDLMDAKANALQMLVDLTPSELSAYAAAPGEYAPPPPAVVRRTALAALAESNLYLNHRATQEFLEKSVAAPLNDDEAELLWPAAYSQFHGIPPKDAAKKAAGVAVLRGWIGDIRSRIAMPPDEVSVRLVAERLFLLGVSAPPFGLTADTRALVDDLLARKGAFPLVRDHREWARTLQSTAAAARYDLDHPKSGVYRSPELYAFADGHGRGYELVHAALEEPLAEADRATRARQIDMELTTAQRPHARCYLLRERAWATSPADADGHFDALLAPTFAGPHVDLRDGEPQCRVLAALSMHSVSDERRAHALIRLVMDRAPLDSACEPMHVVQTRERDRYELAFRLLAEHADLIDTSPELRVWLFANGDNGDTYAMWELYSLERLYRRAFTHATAVEAPSAKRLLASWIEDARLDHRGDSSMFALAHIFALLGAHASTYGLSAEARRLFTTSNFNTDDENGTIFIGRGHAAGRALADL